jgi:hypothetical protein
MASRIQVRGDTAANWTAANPILADREMGYETDTRKLKVGNGTSTWTALPYINGSDSVVTFSATAPALPHTNFLWWNTESGDMYVQYGGAWVGAITTKNGKDGAPGQDGLLTLAEIHAALLVF